MLHMIVFAFDFIFAIKGTKLAKRDEKYRFNIAQKNGLFLTVKLQNTKFTLFGVFCGVGLASCLE